MKNLQAKPQAHSCSAPAQSQSLAVAEQQITGKGNQTMLIGLMVPFLMIIINMAMFSVALPTIRDTFGIQADTTSWVVAAYTLPFMMAMPLYGRLSDGLGKRRLFLMGIAIFLGGTAIAMTSLNLSMLIIGRAVQGVGSAGIQPLSIAIISERFPLTDRGKALGTWNSVGPIAGIIGPLLGGFLVDHWGWRTIFWPVLVVGLVALFVIREQIPPTKRSFVQPGFLRTFDWGGVLLLSGTTSMLVFYLSSRPITGVEPLHDWRLLVATLLLFSGFIVWEQRQANPFVNLKIFHDQNFSRASVGAGLRMFMMGGIGFLLPLYLTDIHGLSAAGIGSVTMLQAVALLITMRLGGQLADRWQNSRWPVVAGSLVQVGAISLLAQLPASASIWSVIVGLAGHGLGAGLSLAPLHRTALNRIPNNQTGTAAGLYSMARSGGVLLGIALGGVILQYGLDHFTSIISAYQMVFWAMAGAAFLGVVVGWGLRE